MHFGNELLSRRCEHHAQDEIGNNGAGVKVFIAEVAEIYRRFAHIVENM